MMSSAVVCPLPHRCDTVSLRYKYESSSFCAPPPPSHALLACTTTYDDGGGSKQARSI